MSLSELRKRAGWALPILALFLLTLLFFYDILKGDYLFVERDLAVFSIPPKYFWVESMRNGEFPLWNPYNLFGQPFFATLQPAILYPPNIIFLILPFSIAFNWSIILHIFLGGVFVYALLRDMDANEWASFIGALSFMLGGYLISVHDLLPTFISVIWTPVIILFFRRAVREGGIKNAVLTGLLLSISFLGGGVEAVLGCLIALSVMAAFSPVIGGKGYLKSAMSLAIAVFILFGLTAVQIIPFLELGRYSIRGGGISYKEATIWSLAPWDVISFFITDPYGYRQNLEKYWANQNWLKTLYTGFLPFILAAFYFIKGRRERLLWAGIVFISFFFALGGYNPLHYYVYSYVPVFNKLRYPVKFLYIAILALSITAGLGMHMLMEKKDDKKNSYFVNAVFISAFASAILLIILAILHNQIESFLRAKGIDAPDYNLAAINIYNTKRAIFYLALFGMMLKIGHSKEWKKGMPVFLSIALIADLFGNMGYYQKMESKEYFSPGWTIEKITSDKDNFRILVTPKTTNQTTFAAPDVKPFDAPKQLLSPSMNLIHKIYDVRGAEVMRVKGIEDVYNAFVNSPAIDATNLAGLFNIKYVVSTIPIESKEFKLVAAHTEGLEGDYDELIEDKTIKIYKNLKFLPRAFLVDDFKVLKNDEEMLSLMKDKSFKPGKIVILEEKPIWDALSSAAAVKRGVNIVRSGNNSIKLKVDAEKRSILVLTDAFYPGWRVFVDGKEEKIYRADYAFRAVPIEAGRHEIEFVYDPLSFKLGLIISLFTLSGIAVTGLIFYLKKNKIQKISEV